MRLLLDTHVLLWLLGDPGRVGPSAMQHLEDPVNELMVSAISALEITTKTRLGKLPDVGLAYLWGRRLAEIGAVEVPVSGAHAALAGSLAWEHRDPFDRVLVAQAQAESATLVTVDSAITALTGVSVLTW